ncbi:MAG: acyltransferase [Pseudomonadota bacterium]
MRKDHRPYFIKKAEFKFMAFYVRHFLTPQFASLGRGSLIVNPWYLEVNGEPISIGNHVHMLALRNKPIILSTYESGDANGKITFGDYCLVSPGTRIASASSITIGDSCMFANEAYISDADWHGIYARKVPVGQTAPICLEDNVWIGDRATVCKGVTIGKNSIIAANAVVTHDIPPDTIAAGVPAKVVKQLDPSQGYMPRSEMFEDEQAYDNFVELLDREALKHNNLLKWLRVLMWPTRKD